MRCSACGALVLNPSTTANESRFLCRRCKLLELPWSSSEEDEVECYVPAFPSVHMYNVTTKCPVSPTKCLYCQALTAHFSSVCSTCHQRQTGWFCCQNPKCSQKVRQEKTFCSSCFRSKMFYCNVCNIQKVAHQNATCPACK